MQSTATQIDAATINTLIRQHLTDANVDVQDVRGDGQYYAAVVSSVQFQGLSLLEQHARVFAALPGYDLEGFQLTTRVA